MSKRLVLVGGGHAHLFVLEAIARGRLTPGETVLICPSPRHAYSGMVPGLIEGRYSPQELEFDLERIASACGAQFVEGRAARLDPGARELFLDDGRPIHYDVISLAIGSEPAGGDLPGVGDHALFVKPIQRAEAIVPALERAAREAGPESVRAVIVGGGAAGVEVALTVRSRLDKLGATRAVVTLVEAAHDLVGDRAPAAIRQARRALVRAEVSLRLSATAIEAGPNHLRLANGAVFPADVLIWATGASAPAWFRESGLPVDSKGFLLVEDTLRTVGAPDIFAAGDAATLRSHPRTPKAGVYAVRAGPVLAHNIGMMLEGQSGRGAERRLKVYQPQRRFLALLNTGDGRAILSYGLFTLTSRWAMWLKDRIDRRFMRRFQELGVRR